ncbi:DUF4012 domain-containing protein [Candidatus Falkowbacteria bacterium]|nr:DUF4012 domain-containing protein [Candidatus Falkowbacteria bacterium]
MNNQLLIAMDLTEIGEDAATALQDLSTVGVEAYKILGSSDVTFSNLDLETKQGLLALVNDSLNKFEDLQVSLAEVDEKLVAINRRNPFFVYDEILTPLQQQLPELKRTIDNSMLGIRLLPALSGFPEEQTYLILLQNNREMRPSGGFIGAYGILKVKDAEVKELFIDNSYNLDKLVKDTLKIEAPAPIQEYMKQEHWFLRDSNWSPDFPTSAQKAIEFYNLEGGTEKIDGVIGLTPTLIEALVKKTGAISVQNLIFDYKDLWEKLEYEVEYGYKNRGIEESDRKDVIGELAKVLIEKLYKYPLDQWPDLLGVIDNQLDERQLLFYFNDNDFQQIAVENDWSGHVSDFENDYIQLVDANLAALKTDSVMERTLTYKLDQTSDELIAQSCVNYQNTGNFGWATTRYRTYSRLYVSAGSELIAVTVGHNQESKVDTYNEFGKTAFGLFLEVEPQSSKQVCWNYKLPERMNEKLYGDGEYKLLFQKQSGIPKINLQLDFNFDSKSFNHYEFDYAEQLTHDEIYNIYLDEVKY